MKEQILTYLNMKDILDRYGIKHRGSQFCCPFHGTDKHPSAKAYEKSFYCFNCGKTGDLIQFVQYYFNLDFNKDTSNRNVSVSDYPLTIRTVKPTDSISINGYYVTANRLMIDWKMPYRVRQYWPVIVNKDNKVIYIPRYRKDFFPNDNLNFFVKISK